VLLTTRADFLPKSVQFQSQWPTGRDWLMG
jgi:hypothetical protein